LLAYLEYDISKCWHRLKTPINRFWNFFYEHNENLNIRCFSIVYVDTTTGILSVLTPLKRGKFRNRNSYHIINISFRSLRALIKSEFVVIIINANPAEGRTKIQENCLVKKKNCWIWVDKVLFLWKNVFLFHMIGKQFFAFLLMRKKYFDWERFWNFFSDNTRVRIFIFFHNLTLGYMTKTPPKSEYFFQQHWESGMSYFTY
jgi:hypothetical protein